MNKKVLTWVDEIAARLQPDQIVWIDGSEEEYERICSLLEQQGIFTRLNEKEYPKSFWAISDPSDVARVEDRTYICSLQQENAGPLNNWRDPDEMRAYLNNLMSGMMKGRTMYVVPYLMGPDGSPFSRVGFELTDSAYVVANMRIMARIGEVALKNLSEESDEFVKGVHAIGTLDAAERYICHFPESREIISVNTNYGGNALQGKKCFALRIASCLAKKEGWLAEHMLILGVTDPEGKKHYICAAFPSACGKTNLAMLVPPKSYLDAGWKVETIGDDIAWLNFGDDGRLYAINPEAGFFGVAPGTSEKTNPNALASLKGNSIFTNTALDLDRLTPWWEGLTDDPPENLKDWKGKVWDAEGGEKAAHPNSRFTAPAVQCPSLSPEWESPRGVPVSAIIFGGRRSRIMPLVFQSRGWQHGTFCGVTMASSATAAAAGKVGVLKRDPMAMRPFIGYHAGDYFQHWLDIGRRKDAKLPEIFHVNWFRKSEEGHYLWPGFGENMRVLEWIIRRVEGKATARETALGFQPAPESLNVDGLNISTAHLNQLMDVNILAWKEELDSQYEFLSSIGDKLPDEIMQEHMELKSRLELP